MSAEDTKFLRTIVVLLEEKSFSGAARKLGIGQSGLTKRVAALQKELGYELVIREGRRMTATPAGKIYFADAKVALEHGRRAVRLSRAANAEAEVVLQIGKSPYTDPYLINRVLSLTLPHTPNLKVEIVSKYAAESAQDLLSGTLDLALLTGIPETARISSIAVSRQPFFVAMLETDELCKLIEVKSDELATRSCILFDRHVQPYLYDDFLKKVRPSSAPGTSTHHVTTAEEAAQLVSRGFGIAVLTQAGAWRIAREGITIRPLASDEVYLETRLASRSDDERLVVSEFVREFVTSMKDGVTAAPKRRTPNVVPQNT